MFVTLPDCDGKKRTILTVYLVYVYKFQNSVLGN